MQIRIVPTYRRLRSSSLCRLYLSTAIALGERDLDSER